MHSDQPESALANYDEAIERLSKLASGSTAVHKYEGALAGAYLSKGMLYAELHRDDEALKSYNEARLRLESLVEGYPKMQQYKHDLESTITAIAKLEGR